MKILFLTTLLASSVLATPLVGGKPDTRIIGGTTAVAGEYPFIAAITTTTSGGTYFCAGALLSNEWIVTAGSCVENVLLFTIRLGDENLKSDSANVLRVSTDTYFLHPAFNPESLENDIGLIKFRLPIILTDYIQPIQLPLRDLQQYAVVTAVGWGQVSDSVAGLVDDLQQVTLTVLSNEECRLSFGNQVTDNMVCVDGNYNEGTCRGDSGGPLIQYLNTNTPTIAGVSSFISQNGCETPEPSGFTRIFPYLEWITNTTGPL